MDNTSQYLTEQFSKEVWFDSIDKDKFGRHVVYAKYMNAFIMQSVPVEHEGNHILLHFAGSKAAEAGKYTTITSLIPRILPEFIPAPVEEDPAKDLTKELWSLKKICGEDTLANIFFEIHDGADAITSESESYPEVNKRLKALYDEYGFDVLFEQVGDISV